MTARRTLRSSPRRLSSGRSKQQFLAALAAGSLVIGACGGGSDSPAGGELGASTDVDPGASSDADGLDLDGLDRDTEGLDTEGLDTDGLDAGQIDLLDDVADGLQDEFDDDESEAAPPPWAGVQLIDARGSVREELLDPDAFSGVTEGFSTEIDEPLGNTDYNNRLLDNSVVAGESLWVSSKTALTRVSLADGSVTATIPVGDVLPDGEFGDITGDADGVYAIAALRGGASFVVDVDPVAGTLRSAIDLSNQFTTLLTIASNGTHVAAAYLDAPGIPVQLIDRATGTVTPIGDYLDFTEVHFVRDELWIVVGSGKVNEPDSYEKYSLDGTPIGEGTLPRTGVMRVFADRAVVVESSNRADPADPIAPIEVEPVGTPIEELLPEGHVTLTAYAEIDGYAISSSSCCLVDESGFVLNTAVVDMSTGEVVHTADSVQATAILPAVQR